MNESAKPASAEDQVLERFQVWIGCLAAYNNGALHGEWVNLADGVDVFDEACKRVLEASPVPDAEELDVFDTNGIGNIGLGTARDLAEWFDEADEPAEVVRVVVWNDDSVESALQDDLHRSYPGDARVYGPFDWQSEAEDAANQYFDDVYYEAIALAESGSCPWLRFDYEAARRDCFTIRESFGKWWAIERE